MPREDDIIVLTAEDNDSDVLIVENSEADNSDMADDVMIVEPDLQENPGPSHTNGRAHLKRNLPNSGNMEGAPVSKKRRPSTEGYTGSNVSQLSYSECQRKQLMELRDCCEALRELVQKTNVQVNKLCGLVSRVQNCCEKQLSLKHPAQGDCRPSLPARRRRNCARTSCTQTSCTQTSCTQIRSVGTSVQPAAFLAMQQPVRVEEPVILVDVEEVPRGRQPIRSMEEPILIVDDPVVRMEEPILIVDDPVVRMEEPVLVVDDPVVRIEEPILIADDPVVRTEEPAVRVEQQVGEQENSLRMEDLVLSIDEPIVRLEEPVDGENSQVPRITSVHSLRPCLPPGSSFPALAVMSYFFTQDAENNTSTISSARATIVAPTGVLPQSQSRPANNPEVDSMPLLEGNTEDSDTTLPPLRFLPAFEILGKIDIDLQKSSETGRKPNDNSQGMLDKEETSPENTPTLIKSERDPSTSSSVLSILSRDENEDTNAENSLQTTDDSTILENNTDQVVASSSFSSVDTLVKQETDSEDNPEAMDCSALVGNENDRCESSCAITVYSDALGRGLDSESAMDADVSGNNSDEEGVTSLHFTPSFALVPVDSLRKAENDEEDGAEMNTTVFLEHESEQTSSQASCSYTTYGYLGDPRRNIRILNIVLVAAQKKSTPNLAACYLVPNLFSKEILNCSSGGVPCQGHHSLDPNKLAALREYLEPRFPNCDLSEYGEDWTSCIVDMQSRIIYLCREARIMQKRRADRNQGSVNADELTSADLNGESDDEVISNTSQLMAASGTRESVASNDSDAATVITEYEVSPHNSDAASETREYRASPQDSDTSSETTERGASPQDSDTSSQTTELEDSSEDSDTTSEEINEPSADVETLEYLGNPRRNIKMASSVINVAKMKPRPQQAARYLIRHLFTDDALMQSDVWGQPKRGMCALDSNKIRAIQEFLQDSFTTFDLAAGEYDWKLCIKCVNAYINGLRRNLRKTTEKLQPVPATAPSVDSEPEDPDAAL